MDHAKPVTVNGTYFKSHKAACRHFGNHPKTVRDRLVSGWSVDDAYSKGPVKRPPKYPEYFTSLPIHAEILYTTYATRRNNGYSHRQAIETPLWETRPEKRREKAPPPPPYFGPELPGRKSQREFLTIAGAHRSVEDHCEFYGINEKAAYTRHSRGMSLAQAITAPSIRKWEYGDFSLYKLVCGVTSLVYIGITRKPDTRLLTHWRCRNAITRRNLPLYKAMTQHGLSCFEFTVLEQFESVEEMCNAEIETIAKLNTQWPNGYNMSGGGEYMATHITGYTVCGIEFNNKTQALEHFGVNAETVKGRRRSGWSEEEAWGLVERKRKRPTSHKGKSTTVDGIVYPSVKAASMSHGISPVSVAYHVNTHNRSVEEAIKYLKGKKR